METNRGFWLAQARRLARLVNLGWWLETLAVPLLAGSVAGAAGLLLVRRWHPEWPMAWLGAGCGGAFLILAFVCWLLARRKFETPEQSLVRLEARMGLHNALSSANAGVRPWPETRTDIRTGLNWQWSRLIVPMFGALALLAAGLFIPLSAQALTTRTPEQPQSWKQISEDLNQLADEQVVDEKYLEETRKKLEELKAQKEEEWFSHSSLEATDSLKKSHEGEKQQMEEQLEKAQQALEKMEKEGGTASAEEAKKQRDEFDKAMQGLQNGAMKPNPELLSQMKQLGPEGLSKLSPEQKQQLKDNLKKHAEAMKCKGPGEKSGSGEGDDWSDELMSGDGKDGKGKGNGPGKDGDGPGEGPGKGAPTRGPGHDPNLLGQEKDGVEIGDPTALQAQDLSRATPGDLLELQQGEHDVDKSGSKLSGGGATDATGKGGDRVWKDSLDPAEQRAVKRFFE